VKEEPQVVVLPETATDAEIIASIDAWAALMEAEDYETACSCCDSPPGGSWTPELLRHLIKRGVEDTHANRRVTLEGVPYVFTIEGRTEVRHQRTEVERWEAANDGGEVAEIWYDLNVDGILSFLTATFRLVQVPEGLALRLYDIVIR
jgi:hypothetical protein